MNLEPEQILAEYQKDWNYKQNIGMTTNIPIFLDFIEGKQWPQSTPATARLPRPVVNICDWMVENKLSNILSQDLSFIFTPLEVAKEPEQNQKMLDAAELFENFAEKTWGSINQDEINKDVVRDALSTGTGIWHYYWDNSIKGGYVDKYIGDIACESIDVLDIAMGNPKLKPIQLQKQPYIIIRNRKDTALCRELSKKNGKGYQDITSDDTDKYEAYTDGRRDITDAGKTTTYIKYYKQHGEVYWTEVCENAIIQKPRRLTPSYKDADGNEVAGHKAGLYPLEILIFKGNKKSTYGRSMLNDVIPTQKMINSQLGFMAMAMEATAWPKLLVKSEAIKQSMTNRPGEIIVDTYTGGSDGAKYMQPPNFSEMPLALNETLLDMTRMTSGVTEVTTGEQIGANMAASAIMALQSQAAKPTEGYQEILYSAIENIGRIYEQFYKCQYNTPRQVIVGDDEDLVVKSATAVDYADIPLSLEVSVQAKTTYDDALTMTFLDTMASRDWITKLQYVNAAPKGSISAELIKEFEEEQRLLDEQKAQQEQLAAQQSNIQSQADGIVSQLSTEEQQAVMANPQLLNSLAGGQ